MKIKWKVTIAGTVYNHDGGVKPGDVMEVDDAEAERVIALGQAEAFNQGRRTEEHAVEQFSDEERAVLNTEIIGASHKVISQPKPVDPDEPAAEVKHQEVTDTFVNSKGESVAKVKTIKEPESKAEVAPTVDDKARARVEQVPRPKPKPVYGKTNPPGK